MATAELAGAKLVVVAATAVVCNQSATLVDKSEHAARATVYLCSPWDLMLDRQTDKQTNRRKPKLDADSSLEHGSVVTGVGVSRAVRVDEMVAVV